MDYDLISLRNEKIELIFATFFSNEKVKFILLK